MASLTEVHTWFCDCHLCTYVPTVLLQDISQNFTHMLLVPCIYTHNNKNLLHIYVRIYVPSDKLKSLRSIDSPPVFQDTWLYCHPLLCPNVFPRQLQGSLGHNAVTTTTTIIEYLAMISHKEQLGTDLPLSMGAEKCYAAGQCMYKNKCMLKIYVHTNKCKKI